MIILKVFPLHILPSLSFLSLIVTINGSFKKEDSNFFFHPSSKQSSSTIYPFEANTSSCVRKDLSFDVLISLPHRALIFRLLPRTLVSFVLTTASSQESCFKIAKQLRNAMLKTNAVAFLYA